MHLAGEQALRTSLVADVHGGYQDPLSSYMRAPAALVALSGVDRSAVVRGVTEEAQAGSGTARPESWRRCCMCCTLRHASPMHTAVRGLRLW